MILKNLGTPQAKEALIPALNHSSYMVIHNAAEGLHNYPPATGGLIAALHHPEFTVRSRVLDALATIHDVRMIEPLIEMLADRDKDLRRRAKDILKNYNDHRIDQVIGHDEESALTKELAYVFECADEQIARRASDISPQAKVYVGPLEKGIFDKLRHVEHVYTTFRGEQLEPISSDDYEGVSVIPYFVDEIRRGTIVIGGKPIKVITQSLKDRYQVEIRENAQWMLGSADFQPRENPQELDIVILRLEDLGLEIEWYPRHNGPKTQTTIDQIYERAKQLGLDLCPPEATPYLWMWIWNSPPDRFTLREKMCPNLTVAMKPIPIRNGLYVFHLGQTEDARWLQGRDINAVGYIFGFERYKFAFTLPR